MGIAIAVGLLFVVLGSAQLLLPDLWWRFHAWSKRVEGVQPERTEEWDRWRGCGGVFLVLFGLGLTIYGCSQSGRSEPTTPYSPPPVYEFELEDQVPEETPDPIRRRIEAEGEDPEDGR